MAYDTGKNEEIIFGSGAAGVFTGTGDIAFFFAGFQPQRLRRVAILVTTALTVTSSIFSLDMQPTAGSAAGRVTAWAGTLTVTTALGAQGKVFVTPELNLELLPGALFIINQTQASTAGGGRISVYTEFRWEAVANLSAMTQLAS